MPIHGDRGAEAPRLLLCVTTSTTPGLGAADGSDRARAGSDFDLVLPLGTANAEVIEAIAAEGHAVGLHYETLTRELLSRGLGAGEAEALIPHARELLQAELETFARRFGPTRSPAPTATRACRGCTMACCC